MKTFGIILFMVVMTFWGCMHLEIANDKRNEGESFWVAFGFGIIWTLLGCIGIAVAWYSILGPYFLS